MKTEFFSSNSETLDKNFLQKSVVCAHTPQRQLKTLFKQLNSLNNITRKKPEDETARLSSAKIARKSVEKREVGNLRAHAF